MRFQNTELDWNVRSSRAEVLELSAVEEGVGLEFGVGGKRGKRNLIVKR